MTIQLADLNDEQLDRFLCEFMQLDDASSGFPAARHAIPCHGTPDQPDVATRHACASRTRHTGNLPATS
jgi:hypothetical protein